MPRCAPRPVVIIYNSRQDAIKAKNYLFKLHGERSWT